MLSKAYSVPVAAAHVKCYPYHTPFANINLKWIIELNVKAKSIKLTKGNRGENPCDVKTVNVS